MRKVVLRIEDLHSWFYTFKGIVKAVDGVSFQLHEKEVLGLVGESGCGKSVTGLSILNLVPEPGKIVKGNIFLNGDNLLEKTEREMMRIRGEEISMIFQNPLASLNPVFSVGDQLCYIIRLHHKCGKKAAEQLARQMLYKVRLPDIRKILKKYPHEMSGGMLQRVMIAMALSCMPRVLIADEPTTALDVTIQAQILNLMNELKVEFNTGILLITHDLGVVAESCNSVATMYAGKIVEKGTVEDIFNDPLHPYTSALMGSRPQKGSRGALLETIEGSVPNLLDPSPGCGFHPRCRYTMDQCREKSPHLIEKKEGHFVACYR